MPFWKQDSKNSLESLGSFALFDQGHSCGLLCVHVDDGTWGGTGPKFKKAQESLRRQLTIKVEKTGPFEVLGRKVVHKPD